MTKPIVIAVIAFGFPACVAVTKDASQAELIEILRECGIDLQDVRPGSEGLTKWIWYWAYEDGAHNRSMNYVRASLASQGLRADFFDRSFESQVPTN